MNPLVTILTPSYNHAKYLDDYFQGLLSQTYANIELILFDDASQDHSWDIICNYEERLRRKISRVLLKRQEQNQGLLRTLANLKAHITGEYVAILESDDYYKPDKVAENIRYLSTQPQAGLVHSDVDFLYPDRVQPNHWAALGRSIQQGEVFEQLLSDNFILTCTFCCRSDLFLRHANFEAYAERGYLTADYAMLLDLARNAYIGYIDKSLAVYRVVPNSISHPEDSEKQFQWKQSYYRSKLDYIEIYGAADRLLWRAQRQYYRNYYEYGYENFQPKEFSYGYQWLKSNFKNEFGSFPHTLRAISMNNKLLWKIVKSLEGLKTAQVRPWQ